VAAGLTKTARERLIDTAAESGVNLLDTADSYAQGDCETFLGHTLQGRRDRFLLATKAGFQFASLGGFARLAKPLARAVLQRLRAARGLFTRAREGAVRHGARSQDFSAERITQCLEASLRRLRTDRVEVFFLHNPPVEALRDERLLAALQAAVQAGKALRYGISTPEPAVFAAALEVPGVTALEVPLHPGAVAATGGLLARAAARGFAIFGNQVSHSGKLLRPPPGEVDMHAAPRAEVARLAAAEGISPHHLLLKFALAQPGVSSVLTGTTNAGHLRENVADIVSPAVLSSTTLAALHAAGGFPAE
jgi:aryl-alcohol dehydrogenase-like predicted oxidoreductase